MRTYGQYCPIARGAEIFAERWNPVIIRNLFLGCTTFSEILEGAPGLSRTLLSHRLTELQRLGIVEATPKGSGPGHRYTLTAAGEDLWNVCGALGEWAARWLELAPEHLEPFVALWSVCKHLRADKLPDQRVVIRLEFIDLRRPQRFWLLIEHHEGEVCKQYPGLDEDLFVFAEAEAFINWHLGRLPWADAIREGRIEVHGPSPLARAFPTWNAGSPFSGIEPARS